jgi:predicted MPP superfamily phosphohydrolase
MPKRLIVVLILIDICFLVARFSFESAGAPHLARAFLLLFIELAMAMVSTFLYKRIVSIPPKNKAKSWPKSARIGLKIFALTWIFLAHTCWIFFYIPLPEDFFFATICFLGIGAYIHCSVFLFTFFFIERFSHILVPLTKNPVLTSETLHTSIAVIFALLLTFQGFFVTNRRPTLKNLNILIRDLPEEFDGFSIALVTDIHIGPTVGKSRMTDIVQVINQVQPDVVAIAGDLVDGYVDLIGKRAKPLKDLRSRYGNFVALGNHEFFHEKVDNWIRFFKDELNLTTLVNAGVVFEKGGKKICFAGVDDLYTETIHVEGHIMDPEKALENCPANVTTIIMAHQPNGAARILNTLQKTNKRVDLILSGHTHAGQMFVVWPLSFISNTFFYGLYAYPLTGAQVYVSSGVNYWGPPIKMLPSLCEVVNIKLHTAPS